MTDKNDTTVKHGNRSGDVPITRAVRPPGQEPFVLHDARGTPYLVPRAVRVFAKGEPPRYFALDPDRPLKFGRAGDSNVRVDRDSISREHGRLSFRDDGRWVYRDLGSRNGSFLSEFVHFDDSEDLRELDPGRDHVVAAGQTLVFANEAARVTLLPAMPEEAQQRRAPSKSPATQKLEDALEENAPHRLPVFLLGPTGSGKTYYARRIHELSGRRGQFVLVNCGALPKDATALHSDLLGHLKGAFTGADKPRQGRFMMADGGTLFLDEVESLPVDAQAFLLDLLDGSSSFRPLGAASVTGPKPDFRLISASKVPLNESRLREDLRFRLAKGGVIAIPTLEERKEDIPALIATFLAKLDEELRLEVRFSPDAVTRLQEARWPGHVRELEGVVEQLVHVAVSRKQGRARSTGPRTPEAGPVFVDADQVEDQLRTREKAFGVKITAAPPDRTPLITDDRPTLTTGAVTLRKRPEDLTAEDLQRALDAAKGNKTHAANALGIAINTLKSKMRRFGL